MTKTCRDKFERENYDRYIYIYIEREREKQNFWD